MPKGKAMLAGGAMASMYVVGRFAGAPVMGWLSDYFVKKRGMPRSVLMAGGLLATAVMFYGMTAIFPTPVVLVITGIVSGFFINFYALVAASAAEIWPIRTTGFVMGVLQTVGQLVGAVALSISGYLAVKPAGGGNFFHEFSGIWYQGIPVCAVAFVVALLLIKQERKAITARLARIESSASA